MDGFYCVCLCLTKFDLMLTCCCCRCQEGNLKYMVAFEQPHHAVQWCLAVQVRAGYRLYTVSLLQHDLSACAGTHSKLSWLHSTMLPLLPSILF
jgi:hypothetical protein